MAQARALMGAGEVVFACDIGVGCDAVLDCDAVLWKTAIISPKNALWPAGRPDPGLEQGRCRCRCRCRCRLRLRPRVHRKGRVTRCSRRHVTVLQTQHLRLHNCSLCFASLRLTSPRLSPPLPVTIPMLLMGPSRQRSRWPPSPAPCGPTSGEPSSGAT